MKFTLTAAVVAAVLGQASAHTWVEEMQVIDSTSGNYTGDYGFTRGYVARTDPGFDGDEAIVYSATPANALPTTTMPPTPVSKLLLALTSP
jgi:hypothetical protein